MKCSGCESDKHAIYQMGDGVWWCAECIAVVLSWAEYASVFEQTHNRSLAHEAERLRWQFRG